MKSEGFINTILNIARNSVVIGAFIVAMTFLVGLFRHTSGASNTFVLVIMAVIVSAAAVYTKRESTRRW